MAAGQAWVSFRDRIQLNWLALLLLALLISKESVLMESYVNQQNFTWWSGGRAGDRDAAKMLIPDPMIGLVSGAVWAWTPGRGLWAQAPGT